MRHLILCLFAICTASALPTQGAASMWLTNGTYPEWVAPTQPATNRFAALDAEGVAGELLVRWPGTEVQGAEVLLVWSADAPGHWPARDWHQRPMSRGGGQWRLRVPFDSAYVPLVFFVVERSKAATNVSPMRVCVPRELGLTEPSRLFWPFLEGFELGMESWRSMDKDSRLNTTNIARNGKSALAVTVPSGRRSVAVGTTRLRGWLVAERQGRGIAVWARTADGTGNLNCTLYANAFTAEQVVASQEPSIALSAKWLRIDLPFSRFPELSLHELDFITFEFTAIPGTTLILDDLSLLGPWRFE